jgi:RNA polymerase sigma-70 factor (ECF subfamily)
MELGLMLTPLYPSVFDGVAGETGSGTIRLHLFGPARTKNNATARGRAASSEGWTSAMTVDDGVAAVDRVLRGDVAAFAEIVERWQDPLVALAYRFCHDRSRAEDMAQEAFVRVFRALHQWRREAAFSTWLFAVATNVYRAELRRRPAPLVSLDDVADPPDTFDLASSYEDSDRRAAVRRALHALPARYRDTLVLFYFHDLDVERAAASLDVPVGTVKARLSRGRELLRRKLATTLGPSDVSLEEVEGDA